jgi:hypothetical protein
MTLRARLPLPERSTLRACAFAGVFLAGCGGAVAGKDAPDSADHVGESGRVGDSEAMVDSDSVMHEDAGPREGGAPEGGGLDTGMTETGAPLVLVTVPLSGCVPYYTANVTLGAGAESFALVLDTGSTTLAVASSACTDCTGVSPLYTPGFSAVDENTPASST